MALEEIVLDSTGANDAPVVEVDTPAAEVVVDTPVIEKDVVVDAPTEEFNPDKFMADAGSTPAEDVVVNTDEPKKEDVKELTLDTVWNFLKEDLSTPENEYKIPEFKKEDGTELTGKEKWDLLREQVLANTDFGIDDFAAKYLKNKSEENFDRKAFLETELKRYNVTDEDRIYNDMRSRFKQEDVSDEDILAEIKGMSASSKKIKSAELKSKESEINARIEQQQQEQYIKSIAQQAKEENELNKPVIEALLNTVKTKKNIGGFEMSDADIQEFESAIPSLMEQRLYKDESGKVFKMSKMDNLLKETLSSHDSALELAYYLMARKNGGISKYINSVKNNVKDSIESKLKPTPEMGGSTSGNQSNKFDAEAFLRNAGV